MAAALLFAAAASGDYEPGQHETTDDVVPGPDISDVPAPVNPSTVNAVSKRGSNAKFVGLNIAGFDFGW